MNQASGRGGIGAWSAVLLAGALLGGAAGCKSTSDAPPVPATMPAADLSTNGSGLRVLLTLPEFVLENQQGDSLDLYDLHGSVWVADFIFTTCASSCPVITHQMSLMQGELQKTPALSQVKLVSFSVDPEHDTPAVLTQYGKDNGADFGRWSFLTGTRDAVRKVVRDGFKLPVDDQADPKNPILHSQSFVLVDREGRVRGLYDATTEDGRKDLRAALDALVAETPTPDLYLPDNVRTPTWLEPRAQAQIASAASITAPHDFGFHDAVGASGITFKMVSSVDVGRYYRAIHYDHGTAVAVADVDGDGKLDLFFANQAGKNGLFRNLGNGQFTDITAGAGVAVGDRACVGASFADIDNDGDPDLFISAVREGNLLFENDGKGHFTDITAKAGIKGKGTHSSGAVFFDYDADGKLDLFVTNVGRYTIDQLRPDGLHVGLGDAFSGHLHPDRFEQSVLYHNLGGGKFEDVSQSSGLQHSAWSGEVTAFDYDEDGHVDLYVTTMEGHNELWRNLGNGHFQITGRSVFPATPWGAMGVKVLDWNGDGHLDLYVTDMHTDMSTDLQPADDKKKHDAATMFPGRFLNTDGHHVLGNALFTNLGGGKFKEESDAANVETGWPWGPSAADLNADGWPDIVVAGGMNYPFRYEGNQVLLNQSGKRFADSEFVLGVEPRKRLVRPWYELDCDKDTFNELCKSHKGTWEVWAARASRSSALIDLDGDGDLDIVTNDYNDVPEVLVSDLAQKHPIHWLTVRLVGKRSNRDGVGAIVTVHAGGRSWVQQNDGKSGYLAQSVMPMYFGLGAATSADSITVKWPTGKTQSIKGGLRSGAPVTIKEP